VLAGSHPRSLEPQTTIRATGFESSTILPEIFERSSPKTYGYVAVQALNSAGTVLETSHTVPVKSYATLFPASRRSG
jgi:hypothetical protein